jgi:S-adenosylmethionine:tRNA ribosyltransferase-isomerase
VSPAFPLPADAEAAAPPEWQGLARDEVRLMAVRPGGVTTTRFRDLPELLEPGDLVVVNTSATLPGRLAARRADGVTVPLHVSTTLDDGTWIVELRRPDNSGPDLGAEPGTVLTLPGDVPVTLLEGFPDPRHASRLRRARTEPAVAATVYLPRHGQPIRYGYLSGSFPLTAYQNVYATEPGSAEMASAGRPFTERLLVRLMTRGILVAPLTLHAGVSSPEVHEPPAPERFTVPGTTARLVDDTRRAGSRVVAVGTTDSGAGRSLMSSPGNAAWCMSVAMSPGSTA